MSNSFGFHDEPDLPDIDWEALEHVFVFANGKGGCGKTTLACNFAGLAASDGLRTLLIDVNGQGNCGLELGYRGTDTDDRGAALLTTVLNGKPLEPASGVRQNLWVVPGGDSVIDIAPLLYSRMQGNGERAVLALARSLAPIARNYDVIVIDSPPENPPLVQLALAASRWLVIPRRSDGANREGLQKIAREFLKVRRVNPWLTLLGVALFGCGSNAKRIREKVRAETEADLGGVAHMFATVIRHAERPAMEAREFGMLVHELEAAAATGPKFYDVAAGRADASKIVTGKTDGLAAEHAALAAEIFTRRAELMTKLGAVH
jgi:chromosome partitioning protein